MPYVISHTKHRDTGMTTVKLDSFGSPHGCHEECITIHGTSNVIEKRTKIILDALNAGADDIPFLLSKLGKLATKEKNDIQFRIDRGVPHAGDAAKLANISPIASAIEHLRRASDFFVQI